MIDTDIGETFTIYEQACSQCIDDLYHRAKRRLWFCTPNTDVLPEQLQVLTKQERLTLAMRFFGGVSGRIRTYSRTGTK